MAPPLAGIKVLDPSCMAPGPFCTLLLSEPLASARVPGAQLRRSVFPRGRQQPADRLHRGARSRGEVRLAAVEQQGLGPVTGILS